ncbi:MAG: hypothetical protein AB8B73_04020 [Ekhidna sp.]
MTKSKKYFLIGAIIFIVILVLIARDFSQRTTWPGAKEKKESTS